MLLVPQHSTVLPSQVDVSTRLTRTSGSTCRSQRGDGHRHRVGLAIAMAQLGGLGVIHKNLSDRRAGGRSRSRQAVGERHDRQPDHAVARRNRIYEALELMKNYRISGVPITEDGSKEGRLVGILTNRDLRFETNVNRRSTR